MNDGEGRHREIGLVALQMSDQMPGRIAQIGQLSALRGGLLNVVFTEVARARFVGRANRRGRLRLAREHKANRIGRSGAPVRSPRDTLANVAQPCRDFLGGKHYTIPCTRSAAITASVGNPITLSRDPSTCEIKPPPTPWIP